MVSNNHSNFYNFLKEGLCGSSNRNGDGDLVFAYAMSSGCICSYCSLAAFFFFFRWFSVALCK